MTRRPDCGEGAVRKPVNLTPYPGGGSVAFFPAAAPCSAEGRPGLTLSVPRAASCSFVATPFKRLSSPERSPPWGPSACGSAPKRSPLALPTPRVVSPAAQARCSGALKRRKRPHVAASRRAIAAESNKRMPLCCLVFLLNNFKTKVLKVLQKCQNTLTCSILHQCH